MTKDEAIEKLERVSKWIDKFPVPTDGATAMMCHLRDVREFLAIEAPTSEAVAWWDRAVGGFYLSRASIPASIADTEGRIVALYAKPQDDRNAASPGSEAHDG